MSLTAEDGSSHGAMSPGQTRCLRSLALEASYEFGFGSDRHQATGAEEGQRRKTHAAEASEKLDTAASNSADAAAG